MPHIIVEYTAVLADRIEIPALLEQMHDALAAQGIDKSRIKTRCMPLPYTVVGNQGADGLMLHATLLLLEGRDTATKKSCGDPLYAAMKEAAKGLECPVTLEIRDMAKDTYYL